MPATEEMIEKALDCLANTTVPTFTASPATIVPGQATTLNWKVVTTAGCSVQLLLNNSAVQKTGTRTIEPAATTTYRLVGKMFGVQSTLASVTVNVNTTQCISQAIDEEAVRQMLRGVIDSALKDSPLSQRSPAHVEIGRDGIALKLRLKVAVDNFFDPDLDIDMVVGVRAVNHAPVISFRSYSNDLSWPWWVTGITLGITEFIDGTIESRIERQMKPLILSRLKEQVESFLQLLPPTLRLQTLVARDNEIVAMICPLA